MALDDGQVTQEVERHDSLGAQDLDGAGHHLDLTEIFFEFLSNTIYTSVQVQGG